jgi:uncharacterized PurR-regulated membrane protein YhhQ (DUF165 family)
MKNFSNFIKNQIADFKLISKSVPTFTILFFTLSVICANLMANKELLNYKYVALDCGFLFSWVMFLCLDIICKRWGARVSVKVSILALAVNLLVCTSFFFICKINGNWGEFYSSSDYKTASAINDALNKTIGGSWYVVFGSATAFLVSSVVNAFFNKTIGNYVERKLQKDNFLTFAIRSYVSTFIAQFADNMMFATIVSKVLFGWTWTQILFCSLIAATFELFCEILFSRFGYRILKKWEAENIGTDYLMHKSL